MSGNPNRREVVAAAIVFLLGCAPACIGPPLPPPQEDGSTVAGEFPDDLRRKFEGLIEALGTLDEARILPFLFPGTVRISRERRERPEVGSDINLPFVREGFSSTLRLVREDPGRTFLLRTDTSWFRFVRDPSGDWKLAAYGDKPIE
jgi:hypothetical protein